MPGPPEHSPTLTPQGREIFDRLREATTGRYEILRELGRGGMAVVFLAYQQSLDRQIAIKVLLPFLAYDTELVERFLREARTQGKLDHPFIIKVFEVHSEGGLTFFTMPYVSGRSLRTLLQEEPQPPLIQMHRYLCQAADALAYAHRRGVIHRDVKPDNMVLDPERDCVILTDFGIAKALAAETTLTTPGDLLGTPQYMSPEQGEGRQDLDGRADQYSLGLIAYEMLAGQRAFQADNLAELMYKHRFEEPESLDRLRPDAPWDMRRTIMRAINKDREDRFPTMEGLLSALEASSTELAQAGEDRTEPMPPPGSSDTTIRVPTLPGRSGRTPPPRKPVTPPPSRTPPAWSKTPSGGTPPPGRTPPPPGGTPPPPGPTPPPPAGPTPARPGPTPTPPSELEVPTYLEVTTPARSSAAEGGDSWPGAVAPTLRPEKSAQRRPVARPRRRRKRVGRAIAVGFTLAAAATLAGLAVWGPLRPLIERYRSPTAETEESVPEVTLLPPGEQQAPGGADEPAVEPQSGGVGVTRATPEAGQETTVSGGEATGGDAASTDAPAARAPDEAAAAREGEAAAAALAAKRSTAESARDAASNAQREAQAARAPELFDGAYADVVARLESANSAFNRRRYDDASTGYSSAASGFRSLTQRATMALRQGGSGALAAKLAMEGQRDSALAAGAVEKAPQELTGANIVANQAAAEFERGDYQRATELFERAGELYAGVLSAMAVPLAGQRAAQEAAPTQTPPETKPPVSEQAADSGAAETEPKPQPEAVPAQPALTAEQIIGSMVDRFRMLFANEDQAAMSRELYRGAIPSGDRRIYNAVFGGADEIQITRFDRQISVSGFQARADIELHMKFRQGTTRESREQDWRLRLHFEASGPGEWQLRRLERR